jgi:DNA repair exonuclease SbcCD ATPase subunit
LNLASLHAGLVDDARIKRKTFESLLQGRTFDEWEQEAASIHSLPQTRDTQAIDEELREVERQRQSEEGEAKIKEQTIEKWKAAYGDWDSLAERLPIKQVEFNKAKEKLDTAPSVPSGYVSAEHLINDLDDAQTRLNANRQPREEIKAELARLDGQLGDRRSEELAEQAEVAERAVPAQYWQPGNASDASATRSTRSLSAATTF